MCNTHNKFELVSFSIYAVHRLKRTVPPTPPHLPHRHAPNTPHRHTLPLHYLLPHSPHPHTLPNDPSLWYSQANPSHPHFSQVVRILSTGLIQKWLEVGTEPVKVVFPVPTGHPRTVHIVDARERTRKCIKMVFLVCACHVKI